MSSCYNTDLDVACPSIEIEMTALDLAKVGKLVQYILLGRFLVYIGHQDDPSFDCYE